jgi:hypothetical protein
MNQLEIAAAGGIAGAVVTLLCNLMLWYIKRHKEGKFSALMIALILEDYAAKCTEPYFELENYNNSPEIFGSPSGDLPKLAEYPDRFNWRAIGFDLTEQVLRFRVKIGLASSSIDFFSRVGGIEEVWEFASEHALELGGEALRIARALRRKHGLPPTKWSQDRNLEEFFTDELTKLNIQRIEDGRRNVEMLKDIQRNASP